MGTIASGSVNDEFTEVSRAALCAMASGSRNMLELCRCFHWKHSLFDFQEPRGLDKRADYWHSLIMSANKRAHNNYL